MSRVVLFSPMGLEGPLGHPILEREEIETVCHEDIVRAFMDLRETAADLFVWEQNSTVEEAVLFLQNLLKSAANPEMKVVCVWKAEIPENLPDFISHSLKYPPLVEEYETALADCVEKPARQAQRYLVRLNLALQQNSGGILCSTVDASAKGVLIESNKSLQVEGVYSLKFMGLADGGLPPLKARILREKPAKGNLRLKYYAASFEGLTSDLEERLEKALTPPPPEPQ